MANQINLLPEVLDLVLYSGDGFSIKFICTDGGGAPIDLTGAVTAQIRLDRLNPDDPALADFTVNLTDAYLGIVILSLSGDQTQALTDAPSASAGRFTGVWDVQWSPANSEPRTLCQGKAECVADVTQ
jgi:hypothetical protein